MSGQMAWLTGCGKDCNLCVDTALMIQCWSYTVTAAWIDVSELGNQVLTGQSLVQEWPMIMLEVGNHMSRMPKLLATKNARSLEELEGFRVVQKGFRQVCVCQSVPHAFGGHSGYGEHVHSVHIEVGHLGSLWLDETHTGGASWPSDHLGFCVSSLSS